MNEENKNAGNNQKKISNPGNQEWSADTFRTDSQDGDLPVAVFPALIAFPKDCKCKH
jgi:hypothetical protein